MQPYIIDGDNTIPKDKSKYFQNIYVYIYEYICIYIPYNGI